MTQSRPNETQPAGQETSRDRRDHQPHGHEHEAQGEPLPDVDIGSDSGRAGRRSHYGEGLSGGVNTGAIEPGRTQNSGDVNR